jgi:23S rRNA pseudouridine955/2504/2580 synthase/23S rRNA pseudouridine1911/1915/1917 synthase
MALSTTAVSGTRLLSSWRDLHAFYKPPALSSEPDRRGETSLVREAAVILGVPPGELHVATRLDAMVSGVVVVAGRDGTRQVAELQQTGALERRYVALVDGTLKTAQGAWDAPVGVGKGGKPAVSGKDARPARTRFAVIEAFAGTRSAGTTSLIVLCPETGRSHQLRVHASHAGAPLLGDVAHGGPRRVVLGDGGVVSLNRVFLHAFRIRVMLDGREQWSAVAACPDDFVETYAALGGPPGSLGLKRLDVLGES